MLSSERREITLGKYKVLITHGHYYYVSLGVEELRRQAVARGYQVAMFGHTHKPYLETKDGVTILNPGSLSYPRQEGRRPSYMIMDIDEAGKSITPRSIFKKAVRRRENSPVAGRKMLNFRIVLIV